MAVHSVARHGSMATPYAACERRVEAVRGALVNSDERRAARRARRDAKRAENRAKRIADCTMENVASLGSLYEAAKASSRGVMWKASVQRYMAHVLRNVVRSRRELLAGKDIRRGFVTFDVFERGKLRHISAVHFPERVVQKSLSRNALAPAVWPTVPEGCTANIKGRGTEYAVTRLKRQLSRHYRKHGTEGYILQVDFSDYFANINHDAAKRLIDRALDDEAVKRLVYDQIDAHGERGLGLGSEVNQVIAVALPCPVDRVAERFPGVEATGRYMDDSYLIAQDKDTLWCALAVMEMECAKLGIVINERKTKVVKLSHGFTFLKKKFLYGENGRVVVRPCRASIARARRRLRKQAGLVRRGVMTMDEVNRSYQSVRGSWSNLDAHRTVLEFDRLYRELFTGIS